MYVNIIQLQHMGSIDAMREKCTIKKAPVKNITGA